MLSGFRHALGLAGALLFAVPANAGPNILVNGDFSQISINQSFQMYSNNNATNYVTVTGWTSAGYNFLFLNGTGVTGGAYSPQYSNYLRFWGAANGGDASNSWNGTSASGGNFIGADGAYQTGPISQTLTGLTIGHQYLLSFNWAGAQQYTFTGPTTEGWIVSFGGQTFNTPVLNNVNHGFTGWQSSSLYFTATATTQTLSFLAVGTPNGTPPFTLLDAVNMQDIPEPRSLAMFAAGFAGLVAMRAQKRRRARQKA